MDTEMPQRPNPNKRTAESEAATVLNTSAESQLASACRIAANLLKTRMAFIALADDKGVSIKASHGGDPQQYLRDARLYTETMRLKLHEALIVDDLLTGKHYRAGLQTDGEPRARFYAGVPLQLSAGVNVGAFGVMDLEPRFDFDAHQIKQLEDLAGFVEVYLRLIQAQIEREKEEQRFRLLAENTTDLVIWVDLDMVRRYVSPAAKQLFGYESSELVGSRPPDLVHPDDVDRYRRVIEELRQGRLKQVISCQRYRHKNGHWIWVEASISLAYDPTTGSPSGFVASLRDVSTRKAIEKALRLSEERLALALDGGSDGMWDWDVVTGTVNVSEQWTSLLGYEKGEAPTTVGAWRRLIHPEDFPKAEATLLKYTSGLTSRLECEYRIRTKGGSYTWALTRGKVVTWDANGAPERLVGTYLDLTRRKAVEQELNHLATHDVLTGLLNRMGFRQYLEAETQKAEKDGYMIAVLACDLDRFKVVNDTFGHSTGDTLLRTIAQRISHSLRERGVVGRLGGDEFAIVLGKVEHPDDASLAAIQLIQAVEQPIELGANFISVGVSVGICIGPASGRSGDYLFKNADIALYKAKAAGRNTYRFYEAGMGMEEIEHSRLEQDMRKAISNGDFALHYQPIVSLGTGAITGMEALLRWFHPTRGAVEPSQFIPVAEETRLIIPLGQWALREACFEASSWPNDLRIAVNISAVQLQLPGFEQSVVSALASSGLAPQRLELEITESLLVQDAAAVIASLKRLHSLGVRIVLDDFGTGYSSLNYLRQFPFSKIKIDRSFVQAIADPFTAAIVRAVVGIAVRVGAAVTAEGVENDEQLAGVRAEGCTEVQGFLVGMPLSANDTRKLISQAAAVAA